MPSFLSSCPLVKRNYVIPILGPDGKFVRSSVEKKRMDAKPVLLDAAGNKIPPEHAVLLDNNGNWITSLVKPADGVEAAEKIAFLMQVGVHHLPVTEQERNIIQALDNHSGSMVALVPIIERIRRTNVYAAAKGEVAFTAKQGARGVKDAFLNMIIAHRQASEKSWMLAFQELKRKMGGTHSVIVLPPELEKSGKKEKK